MPTEQQPQVPFNEQAALEELERLQRALEESRQRRKDASAAFDQFVSSFRRGEPARPVRQESSAWPRTDAGPSTLAREGRVSPPVGPTATRKPFPKAGLVVGTVIALSAGFLLTRMWRSAPVEPSSPSSISTPSSGERAAAAPPADQSTSAAPVTTESELRALRYVWVRATVDGKRVLERELDAGDRVPLNGRTIVIRAGDAGAVQVIIDGRDRGVVGETGVALTRTYTASAGAADR